jgi:hypothetical protein
VSRSGAFAAVIFLGLAVFAILTFIPQLAVTVRRLHDSDKSGWWLLLVLIPYVGAFIIFIFTLLDSSSGFNRYGPPYGELPGDKHVQYWGTTREEAWAKFVADAPDAAANGYQPVNQKWIPYVGGQSLDVLYRGSPLNFWGGGQIPNEPGTQPPPGPPRWK